MSEQMSSVQREPEHLLCPITHVMFQDPVLVDSGRTYERWAILKHWQLRGQPNDPLSNLDLASDRLAVDWQKRREVEAFVQEHLDYTPDGWEDLHIPPPQESQQIRFSERRANRCRRMKNVVLLGPPAFLTVCWFLAFRIAADSSSLIFLLRENPRNDWVQSNACAALANLAFADLEKSSLIVQAGGVTLLMAAMQMHPNQDQVLRPAMAALANLAFESADNSAAIILAGGAERLTEAMERRSESPLVLRNAFAALERLAIASEAGRSAIAQAGGIQSILTALKKHPMDAVLQMHGCAALECLMI
ncbi:unnamed protein product, partial [Polarella glacialis]